MNNPVLVREIKRTSNPEMMNVVFEQELPRPVVDLNSLLNFANAGNSNFGSNMQKRVAFFNFSPQMIAQLGLVAGQHVNAELNAKLVVHEFCAGDLIPDMVQSYYEGAETYQPRSWKLNEGTPQEVTKTKEPKMTPRIPGKEQQTLTKGGKAIYRETHLALMDMVKDDILLQHDNRVTGTAQAARDAATVGATQIG